MNALAQVFTFSDYPVRTVVLNDEPWFVASDICKVLGLTNVTMALRPLEEDEKGFNPIDTPGGTQIMAVVSESGMYALVVRSDKPNAKPFRRWVTSEVLPSIRKTGTYSLAQHAEPTSTVDLLASPEGRRSIALAMLAEADRADRAEAQLAIAAPKVALVDGWIDPRNDTSTVLSVAGHFGVTEPKFREYLVEHGVIYRRVIANYIGSGGKRRTDAEWHAKGQYKPWFTTCKQPTAPRMHNGQTRTTLYFNPIGLEGVARLVAKHPINPAAITDGSAR